MSPLPSTSTSKVLNQLPDPHPLTPSEMQSKRLETAPQQQTSFPPTTNQGVRVCQVIGLKPEQLEEYERIHEKVWPSVLAALRRAKVVGELCDSY